MFLIPKWIVILCLAGVLPPCCSGVHVFVRDQKRYAVLFQSVVLPCHYTSVSTQTPVVQWVYKSYCHDRTRDAFRFSEGGTSNLGGRTSGRSGGAYETAGYLECSDTSRTVRIVASIAGSSITLSEYYKNRDISIINKADLRIGEVRWGDSGVYICKVVISDDPEGQNEAPVELLVLGFLGVPEDLLPGFELKLMPVLVCLQVTVPKQTYTIVPLSSVTLRCDFATSANLDDVLVTWRYKSFCKEHVLDNNLILEEITLYLGEDRYNDCPDSERTVHPVIQKIGKNNPVLGKNYSGRGLTIKNKADLVISEVKLSDAGVYFCSVDAAGDFTEDGVKKVKLFVKPEEQSQTTEKLQIRLL